MFQSQINTPPSNNAWSGASLAIGVAGSLMGIGAVAKLWGRIGPKTSSLARSGSFWGDVLGKATRPGGNYSPLRRLGAEFVGPGGAKGFGKSALNYFSGAGYANRGFVGGARTGGLLAGSMALSYANPFTDSGDISGTLGTAGMLLGGSALYKFGRRGYANKFMKPDAIRKDLSVARTRAKKAFGPIGRTLNSPSTNKPVQSISDYFSSMGASPGASKSVHGRKGAIPRQSTVMSMAGGGGMMPSMNVQNISRRKYSAPNFTDASIGGFFK